ncbi:pentapeptide repeat-containing protein [Wenxinia marina]|uniref:Putative low-complexity protein n=1 Tax=Wenxinia marina DSM 24838 TaxID=1123501 RepID=A0A0D0PIW1_9RHOB|nr:pentapeptide repeat-containing protein [Wenxinia marina]KIQ71321.1 putative low-complexity protein [Wenxinia marina DSM 24838]GGL73882.1 hypothetical protein GCM10011392_30490 [Wenxinia marina]
MSNPLVLSLTASAIAFVLVAVMAAAFWRLARPRWMGFEGRTLWDWLGLILSPGAVAAAAAGFGALQFVLSERRANEEIFVAYVDRVTALLVDPALAEAPETARAAGRAQTVAVLSLLPPEQAGRVVRFLAAIGRLDEFAGEMEGIDLTRADLSDLQMSGIDLEDAALSGADLEGADLEGADLSGADLTGADLDFAVLRDADLSGAALAGALMRGTDLRGADLRGAIDLRTGDLAAACTDAATLFPPGVDVPPACADPAAEDDDDEEDDDGGDD